MKKFGGIFLLFFKKGHKFYRKYFISYLIVFFIPFTFFGVISYISVMDNTNKALEKSEINQLESLKENYDNEIKRLHRLSTVIYGNYNLNLSEIKNNESLLVDDLKKYRLSNYQIDNIVVLYINSPKVHTSEGTASIRTLTKYQYKFFGFNEISLVSYLSSLGGPTIRTQGLIDGASREEDGLVAFIFPPPSYRDKLLSLVFVMNDQEFVRPIKRVKGETLGGILILDNHRNIVMNISDYKYDVAEKVISLISRNHLNSFVRFEHNKNKYILNKIKSNETGWTYISIKEQEYYYSTVNKIKIFILIIIVLILLTGITLTVYIMNINYKPINNLMDFINFDISRKFKKNNSTEIKEQINEFEFIKNIICNINEENKYFEDRFKKNKRLIYNQCLLRLIKGEFDNIEQTKNELEENMIKFEYQAFVVCVANVKLQDGTVEELFEILNKQKFQGMNLLTLDLILEDRIVILLNLDKSSEITKRIEGIFDLCNEKLGVTLKMGIGLLYEDIRGICESYLEACTALEYEIIINQNKIMFFNSNIDSQHSMNWDTFNDKMKFIQSLKKGDNVIASKLLAKWIDSIRSAQTSLLIIRHNCVDIINTVVNVAKELGIILSKESIKNSVDFQTIEKLESALSEITSHICKNIEGKKSEKEIELLKEILNNIEANYLNSSFGLNTLSDNLELSVGHLSRFFKKYVGVNFSDYLSNLRIEKSKYLLVNTDLNVKAIVNEIGYMDTANFTRKFKMIEGMTPLEYKKRNSNSQ